MTDDPRHRPVLADEAVAALAPRDGGTYVDATFGAGGYARRILRVAGTRVVGIDRDPNAVRDAAPLLAAYPERLTLDHARFATLDDVCARHGIAQVDGVVMDVGVSSMQLDDAMRGFSFRFDGPLDMRMSGEGPSAADVVARASEKTLADLIYLFGEERQSRRIARAIATDRAKEPLDTTRKLAELIGRVVRSKPHEIHPATRTFQALRILVNGELDELQAGLEAAERVLKPGGRLAVVSFHSLEDRIVKTFLAARAETSAGSRHLPDVARSPARFVTLARKPVTAGDDELRDNPRARSAKLRSAERTAEPSLHDDDAPSWPDIHDVLRGG